MAVPTRQTICEAWFNHPDLPGEQQGRSVSELRALCWACDRDCTPQRAHINANANGGSSDPLNFFLLCKDCHEEQPDGAPRELQLRWINEVDVWWNSGLRTLFNRLRHHLSSDELEGLAALPSAELRSAIERGSMRSASSRLRTIHANMAWGLIEKARGTTEEPRWDC
jgi:hypothetical protein